VSLPSPEPRRHPAPQSARLDLRMRRWGERELGLTACRVCSAPYS
jgi:hypothetical protein